MDHLRSFVLSKTLRRKKESPPPAPLFNRDFPNTEACHPKFQTQVGFTPYAYGDATLRRETTPLINKHV